MEARSSFSVDNSEVEIRENLDNIHSDSEILIAETDVNLHITGRVQFRTGSTFHMRLGLGFWISSSKQLATKDAQNQICI